MRTAKVLTYSALALVAGWCGAGDAALPSHPEPATSDLRSETPKSAAELRERVSRTVAVVVGWSDVRSSRLRVDAIRALAKPLSEDDVQALLWFLDEKFSQQEEYDLLTFNALKNDALGFLLERPPPPDGIGQSLVKMFRDQKHDAVWQDYCVQYFAVFYQARRRSGATAADRELRAIETAYWDAVATSNSTTAGTALIGLRQLAGEFSEIDGRRVATRSLALATNPSAEEGARVTAMQTCAELGDMGILPLARTLATDSASGMMRLSAVGVLGRLGTGEDVTLLTSLAAKGEKRIRTAADAALKRMEHRRVGHEM